MSDLGNDRAAMKQSSIPDHASRVTHHVSAFAIWVTGLPASGKSTIVAALKPKLEGLGLTIEVLESDAVRRLITPVATYAQAERDQFYRAVAFVGARLVAHGVTVVFDATANRRAYREFARHLIPRFLEISVDCPLNVCLDRDKKGTYRKGARGESSTVPGLQEPYEMPLNPDLLIDTTKTTPENAADRILSVVRERMIISPS
jgi:adenylylsulfate kinase